MTAFRVLGEVQLRTPDTGWDVGPPKQRAVLAALVVDAGRVVSVDTLVDRVWDDPPAEARNALYAHIMRIRRLLSRAARETGTSWRLVRRAGGYVLDVDPDLVDVHRFRRLADQAAGPGRPDGVRTELLSEAMALWRGTPMAGLSGEWVDRFREGCHQQRIHAMVTWAQTQLRLGRPEAVTVQVPEWLTEYPLVEPLTAALMRALHAVGRSAEALDRYGTTRQRMVAELGAEPGPDLKEAYQLVLRGGEAAAPPAAALAVAVPAQRQPARQLPLSSPVPAQLPLDLAGFVGRTGELEQLRTTLPAAGETPAAVTVVALTGSAGAGKTTLAVHWAHQVADRFPDGQLYVNLRGFGPAEPPLCPSEVVCRLLADLGVPRPRIPTAPEAQEALFRSVLAGRRMLLLLDNARDADQVRPLLPGSPGCLVLVTSRDRLIGLAVTEEARLVPVDLFPVAEARQLLIRRLGRGRVAAEPGAADDIIAFCSRLPLALTIVAARAATRPHQRLAAVLAELRDLDGALDGFAGTDTRTDLRVVFSWSSRLLSPPAARLFRLLGLPVTTDIGVAAAASLVGLPARQVATLLAELTGANLVTDRAPGRYGCHDLLRLFARESAHRHDGEAEVRHALGRLLDHYLHTAHRATVLLYPQRDLITLTLPADGVRVERLDDHEAALRWFTDERDSVLALVEQAAAEGFDDHAWQLAWALTTVLDWWGHWRELAAVQRTALLAAGRAYPPGQIHAHRGLGRAYTKLGRLDDAYHQFRQALELSSRYGDDVGRGNAYLNLCWVRENQHRNREALDHGRQALAVFRAAGHRAGQARALNAIGWNYTLIGDHRQALEHCEEALGLNRELGNRHLAANTWDSLGHAHHQLGDFGNAAECYERARELFREVGDRFEEMHTLLRIGDLHAAAGDPDRARVAWRGALAGFEELGHPDAARARSRLSPTAGPGTATGRG